MGFRGNGEAVGRGAPNPDQLQRYIDNGGFFVAHIPEEAAILQAVERAPIRTGR